MGSELLSTILNRQAQGIGVASGGERTRIARMTVTPTSPCANCERLQAQVKALAETVAQLQATVSQLQQQLAAARKDSSNSSKPPSSDIVKPSTPSTPGQGRRKPGGQPGHPRHQRALFPPQMLSSPPQDYVVEIC